MSHADNDGDVAVPRYDLLDQAWCAEQESRHGSGTGASGYTMEGWISAVRAAKKADPRCRVVMHLFAGEGRHRDYKSHVTPLAKEHR